MQTTDNSPNAPPHLQSESVGTRDGRTIPQLPNTYLVVKLKYPENHTCPDNRPEDARRMVGPSPGHPRNPAWVGLIRFCKPITNSEVVSCPALNYASFSDGTQVMLNCGVALWWNIRADKEGADEGGGCCRNAVAASGRKKSSQEARTKVLSAMQLPICQTPEKLERARINKVTREVGALLP